ncbi:MAG: hypothetical protein KTR15_00140 [Phycisphaeraceae bacterium]|nr:hypothetical protein [Phycisphaeraceae bacterium]
MNIRTVLPLILLACCLVLVGCKKSAVFLVVDAATKKPLTRPLVDHNRLYEFPDENAGDPYLMDTLALDGEGRIEIKKPKKGDTFVFRLAGYRSLKARISKPGEEAEYLVVAGPKKIEWVGLEKVEDESDDEVTTWLIPLKAD